MADQAPPPASAPLGAMSGSPPPRPGDPIPEGGIDPTQVFAAPPAPPPPPQGFAGGEPGDAAAGQTAPLQDSGKPPPPAGTSVDPASLKAQGYDDEDVRVLGIVGNYRFGSIATTLTTENITVPPHPETLFDEQKFLKLLAGSISLMRDEKWRIIFAIPNLSQFQIDELVKILEEEKRKFSELSPKHLLQLQKLEQKHAEEWRDLQAVVVQQTAKRQEEAQADAIRKQLGL